MAQLCPELSWLLEFWLSLICFNCDEVVILVDNSVEYAREYGIE
jgi:hypothetical protein